MCTPRNLLFLTTCSSKLMRRRRRGAWLSWDLLKSTYSSTFLSFCRTCCRRLVKARVESGGAGLLSAPPYCKKSNNFTNALLPELSVHVKHYMDAIKKKKKSVHCRHKTLLRPMTCYSSGGVL